MRVDQCAQDLNIILDSIVKSNLEESCNHVIMDLDKQESSLSSYIMSFAPQLCSWKWEMTKS
jgi:hypothetical protein